MADLMALIATGLAALAAVAGLLWRARPRGVAEERDRQATHDRETAVATRRRMDDAAADLGSDPDVLRDWLRQRGGQ
jgi:hypothetical protein